MMPSGKVAHVCSFSLLAIRAGRRTRWEIAETLGLRVLKLCLALMALKLIPGAMVCGCIVATHNAL